jgi:DNA-directed RNA polymerase specialized sigma24 family protein
MDPRQLKESMDAVISGLRSWYHLKAGVFVQDDDGTLWFFPVDSTFDIDVTLSLMPKQWAEVLRLLYCEGVPKSDAANVLGISRLKLENLRYLALLRFLELWLWSREG